jgi:NAD(P)-dependent dehydrogenase (short-subunit alcohol dehydrogenase family)
MDLGIKGHVALITGAGRHIGLDIARGLAQEGARVAINDLVAERAESAAEDIRRAGGQALAVPADVTDLEQMRAAAAKIIERWGSVHVLVNNAGIPVPASAKEGEFGTKAEPVFLQTTPADWRRWTDVNYFGTLNATYVCLPHMQKAGYGRLIGIISDAARTGGPRLAVYAGAKAAILAFMKSIAGEYARFGVTANCVSLGAFIHEDIDRTWGTPEEREKRRQMFLSFYPLAKKHNRLTLGSDAAFAVAMLASRESEWITGQVFSVSGGYCMAG